jgi:glycosyltransferase involved in cell wall biosynthesis
VLICNTVKTAPFAYFAHELGIPSVVIVRESFDPSQRFSALKGEARMAVEVGLTEADHIVFVANESREAWRDFRFEGKVHIINNGVDSKRFETALAMSKAEARAALGLPDDEFIAVCVGSIGTRKGQAPMARAFADLPPDVSARSRILFIGAAEPRHLTPFRAALDEAEALVGARLTHVMATEDIGLYYRAADVLLMNSSNEAYPRSVMEGLLFGVPVLSTRVFGVMTQVTDDANGLLYDIGDLDAWRHLFTRLAEDPVLLQRLGDAARRSFWRHTTTGEMLARYRGLIGQMAHAVRASTAS